jgi:cation:H+ antiporter
MLHGVVADLVVVAVCAAGLYVGAVSLVGGATTLASWLGVPGIVVGLTVVAVGTSTPELVVTVAAATAGEPSISVGNVVGSNVFNLGFILGGLALARGVPARSPLAERDALVLLGAGVLVTVALVDGTISRVEAGLLVAVWVAYILFLLRAGGTSSGSSAGRPGIDRRTLGRAVAKVVLGLVVLVLAGRFLVAAATDLARLVGVSEWAIGTTVVAAGTSMPELATSAVASARGEHGVSVGNLLGSDISNLLLVLGVAGVVTPLSAQGPVVTAMGLLVATVAVTAVLLWTGRRLSRPEGALLIAVAVGRYALTLG